MKAHDIIVALSLCSTGAGLSYAEMARNLGISASEVHASVSRLKEGQLIRPESRVVRHTPLLRFLEHGLSAVFPVRPMEPTRGIATAWAAPALQHLFPNSSQEVPIWPDNEGNLKGYRIEPLHPSVPKAVQKDETLYKLLALVDVVRIGQARERKVALNELKKILEAAE